MYRNAVPERSGSKKALALLKNAADRMMAKRSLRKGTGFVYSPGTKRLFRKQITGNLN